MSNNRTKDNNIPRNLVISIAGSVGVGKSTLTEKLAEALGFKTSFENVDDNPYIDKFYKNQKLYGFHLQVYFLAEKMRNQKIIHDYGGGFVQDRTIYEDVEIFAKMNYDKGNMNEEDFRKYLKIYETMNPYFKGPDLVIYLEGNDEQIIKRISERSRDAEMETPLSYWNDLLRRYEKWIDEYSHSPVVRININEYDLINVPESINVVIYKIKRALNLN